MPPLPPSSKSAPRLPSASSVIGLSVLDGELGRRLPEVLEREETIPLVLQELGRPAHELEVVLALGLGPDDEQEEPHGLRVLRREVDPDLGAAEDREEPLDPG